MLEGILRVLNILKKMKVFKFIIEKYNDVLFSKMNPLVHYELFAKFVSRFIFEGQTPLTEKEYFFLQKRKNVIFVDVSHYVQTDANSGIQRVVNKHLLYMKRVSDVLKVPVVPVVIDNEEMLSAEYFLSINRAGNCNIKRSENCSLFFRNTRRMLLGSSEKKQILHTKDGDILVFIDAGWALDQWAYMEKFKKRGGIIAGIIYDLIPLNYPQFFNDDIAEPFNKWLLRTLDYYDMYIAISETVNNDMANYIETNAKNKYNYILTYNFLGSDITNNQPVKNKILQDIFDKKKSVYLTVSTIEPRKNHKYLIDAFDILWSRNIDVVLCIVGKIGWKAEDTVKRIKEHKLYDKNLFMFNDVNDSELDYCYSKSKVFIYPSVVEGFGLPIVESLQHNLAVLASDIPVHREIGGDKIAYFDIENRYDLAEKIENIEAGSLALNRSFDNMPILTWEESVVSFYTKVFEAVPGIRAAC